MRTRGSHVRWNVYVTGRGAQVAGLRVHCRRMRMHLRVVWFSLCRHAHHVHTYRMLQKGGQTCRTRSTHQKEQKCLNKHGIKYHEFQS